MFFLCILVLLFALCVLVCIMCVGQVAWNKTWWWWWWCNLYL